MDEATFQTFDAAEQARWHNHTDEMVMPDINITLPDLSAEEAAQVAASLQGTYGKIFIVWDSTIDPLPVRDPVVSIVSENRAATPTP